MGEVRINHKRHILLGVTQSWQRNMVEQSFVILQWVKRFHNTTMMLSRVMLLCIWIFLLNDKWVMLLLTLCTRLLLKYLLVGCMGSCEACPSHFQHMQRCIWLLCKHSIVVMVMLHMNCGEAKGVCLNFQGMRHAYSNTYCWISLKILNSRYDIHSCIATKSNTLVDTLPYIY